jgi:hypothetical protein
MPTFYNKTNAFISCVLVHIMHIPLLFLKGLKLKSKYIKIFVGRDSSVGIVTRYRLDGPGIESLWGARFSAPVQTGSWGPPSLLYKGYLIFSGVKATGAWR